MDIKRKITGIQHVGIPTNDMQKSIRFYKELGFEVVSEKNHYKIVFKGDEKYWFPISKTPSDGRSGRNLASDIIKRLSIYK